MGDDEDVAALVLGLVFGPVQDGLVEPLADLVDETVESGSDVVGAPINTCQPTTTSAITTHHWPLFLSVQRNAKKRRQTAGSTISGRPMPGGEYVLAAGTAIPPDVPVCVEALVEAAAADVRAGDALVVAVVPLADVLGDLDPGGAAEAGVGGDVAVALPGEGVGQAEVE